VGGEDVWVWECCWILCVSLLGVLEIEADG